MRYRIFIFLIPALLFALFVCELDAFTLRSNLTYFPIDGQKIKVNGLYGFSYQELIYRRLDPSIKEYRPDVVWQFVYPKGGRIRFKTNSSQLHVPTQIIEMPDLPPAGTMNLIASRGIDVYINGVFHDTLLVEEDHVLDLPQSDPPQMNDFELYLPCLTAIRIEKIGVDQGAIIEAPGILNKTVLFYGTSIEWGSGGVSRMSLTYPDVLSRALGFDFYNFGFRSSAWGEDEMVDTLAQIPSDVFVLSYVLNVNWDAIKYTGKSYYENVVSFVEKIKYYQPGSKVIVVSPFYNLRERYNSAIETMQAAKRRACKEAVDYLSGKYTGVFYFDGKKVPFHSNTYDGFGEPAHPNDLGHMQIAGRLKPLLRQVLSLSQNRLGSSTERDQRTSESHTGMIAHISEGSQ